MSLQKYYSITTVTNDAYTKYTYGWLKSCHGNNIQYSMELTIWHPNWSVQVNVWVSNLNYCKEVKQEGVHNFVLEMGILVMPMKYTVV